MSDFLLRSACKGRKPQSVAPYRQISRPDLIARLLRERHVARFLVAPDGYGKTMLAREYADVVFAFEHVFWVNGRSPCFLRDLDAGVLARCLLNGDAAPALVVLEDVPAFDSSRCDALSHEIDCLLEGGKEVIVTCAPSGDAYADRHRDRLRLAADDLLLTPGEALVSATGKMTSGAEAWSRAERAACLRWGDAGVEGLLSGIMREGLPADLLLSLFVLLSLERGALDDLRAFLPSVNEERLRLLDGAYPFLGIDLRAGTYETVRISPAVLVTHFNGALEQAAACSLFETRDALAARLANALLAKREAERACVLVGAAASKEACAEWLVANAGALMELTCVKAAYDLHKSIGRAGREIRGELQAAQAWRLLLLGEDAEAAALARRYAFSAAASDDVRCATLQCVVRIGNDEERARAEAALAANAKRSEIAEETSSLERAVRAACCLLDKPEGADMINLLAQRNAVRRDEAESARLHVASAAARGVAADGKTSYAADGSLRPPPLRVNLLGGMEVWVGDTPVAPRLLSRQKTRTFLGMLVLSRGKELTRDFIVSDLWPDSSIEQARRNFYTVWSQLRRALSVRGECLYLFRDQFGCRIDASLVQSDVAQLEETCRTLMFGHLETNEWENVFALVRDKFAGELLPNEHDSEFIIRLRDEYRIRLVDALIAASGRLLEAGEVRGGLWFAREAMKRDRTREDAYVAQMEAQMAGGQRTAALETYFLCRRYLAEELGIDPTPRVVQLYRDIIETEEAVDW